MQRLREITEMGKMGLGKRIAGGVLMALLGMGSGALLPGVRAEGQEAVQITPGSVAGQLDENSQVLPDDGSYYNIHTFEGVAGGTVSIEMVSEAFDAYLILIGPSGEVVGQDDDSGGGTNSRIMRTLPSTGVYQIFANSYSAGETGHYTLTWQPVDLSVQQGVAASHPLRQVTPESVTGWLNEHSRILDGNRYFETYSFDGVAGETVLIEMFSEEFDPYIGLSTADGSVIAQDSGWLGSRNPQIIQILPYTGTYQIVVTHYSSDEPVYRVRQTGQYRLSWRLATAEDIARANAHEEAMTRAASLRRQAVELSSNVGSSSDEAIQLSEEALAIYREQLGNRHPDVADNLLNVGRMYRGRLRYSEAEVLLVEAVQIYRENLRDQYFLLSRSLNQLAVLYEYQGRYSEAEAAYIEALEINRQESGLDERYLNYVPTALSNLAGLYITQGRYSEAESLHLEAFRMRRERFGEQSEEVGGSLAWLAYLYQAQGRYEEAEPLFLQAIEIDRRRQAPKNEIAINLNNLALLYHAQGRYSEAEPLFIQSIDIYRELLESEQSVALTNLATSLRSLGTLHIFLERYTEAEPLLLEAVEIYQQHSQLGDQHPDNAANLFSLASIYQFQEQYNQARILLTQALSIYREQLGNRHPDVARTLNQMALLYNAEGNVDEASRLLQEGLDVEEWNLDLNLATLADIQRKAYSATILDSTNQILSISLQANSLAAQQLALTTLLRRKGRLLDAGTNSLQVLRQNLTPEDQATLEDLTTVRQQLSNLTFNPPANLPPDQYRAQLTQLEAEANTLEATLARRSAAFRAETQPIEIAAVQAKIPTNSVLIEYVRYRPFDASAAFSDRFGPPRYAAYLLFPNGTIQAIDLGPAAEIDDAVQSFTRLLQDTSADLQRTGAPPTLRPDVVENVTSNIQALILAPLLPHLQSVDHLLISPDSQLNRLPFEALQTDDNRYLVEQYQISYLNSGRDLLKFDAVEPSRNPAVILANPNYETADDSVQVAQAAERSTSRRRSTELSQLQVGPLPGTAAEAEAIRPVLPNAQILTEAAATENALKQVQRPRILHIATHGFFLPNVARPELSSSGGLVASDSPLTGLATTGTPVENPLLRSGLALAGFNPRSSGNEDGVLTALEVSNLNLFGTQLVVLSACDTGLGDIASGEGVYGLRRAFSIAGAETQLMSLWQVSDFGTQSLMARYYQNLTTGMGRSEALRAVQLEMINEGGQYSHPYYWAAFILAGDWRPLE